MGGYRGEVFRAGTIRRATLGAATGFAFGYAAMRAAQALRDLREPYPARGRREPKRYGSEQRTLMLAGVVRAGAALAATAFILADPLESALRPLPRPLRAPAFACAVLVLDGVRDLGVDYIEGHVRERSYGLSNQAARGWLEDQAKGLAVGLVVSAIVVALADTIVLRAPRHWPLVAIAATPALLAFATIVAPTFILPLFNTYEPVTGDLEQRIRALAARYGAGNAAILRFDMSRQTKKANAFVTGVLGTERIVLGDTLVEAFPNDETLFVVAHELGHYVRRDPWLGIGLGTASLALTLLVANAALQRTTLRAVDGPAQGARLAFYATLVQLTLVPLLNAASRAMESRADRFALAATGDAAAGVRAFTRLGEQNLADPEPPRWAELLFGSHPTLAARIRELQAMIPSPVSG
jgi:Zn-dependent protease with chaperone function